MKADIWSLQDRIVARERFGPTYGGQEFCFRLCTGNVAVTVPFNKASELPSVLREAANILEKYHEQEAPLARNNRNHEARHG